MPTYPLYEARRSAAPELPVGPNSVCVAVEKRTPGSPAARQGGFGHRLARRSAGLTPAQNWSGRRVIQALCAALAVMLLWPSAPATAGVTNRSRSSCKIFAKYRVDTDVSQWTYSIS